MERNTVGFRIYKVPRVIKFIDMKNVVARSWEERGMECYYLMGAELMFYKMKESVAQQCECTAKHT